LKVRGRRLLPGTGHGGMKEGTRTRSEKVMENGFTSTSSRGEKKCLAVTEKMEYEAAKKWERSVREMYIWERW